MGSESYGNLLTIFVPHEVLLQPNHELCRWQAQVLLFERGYDQCQNFHPQSGQSDLKT